MAVENMHAELAIINTRNNNQKWGGQWGALGNLMWLIFIPPACRVRTLSEKRSASSQESDNQESQIAFIVTLTG